MVPITHHSQRSSELLHSQLLSHLDQNQLPLQSPLQVYLIKILTLSLLLISAPSLVTSPSPASPIRAQEEAQRSSESVSRPGPRTLTPLPPQSPESVVTSAPSPPIFTTSSPLVTSPAPLLVTSLASQPRRGSSRGQPSASRQPKLINTAAPSLQDLQQSAAVQSQAATQPRVLQSVVNNLATSPTSAAGPATSPRLGNPALASGLGSRGVGLVPRVPAPGAPECL